MEFSKTLLRKFFFIFITIVFISCDQQQERIDQVKTEIKDAENNIEKMGASDWEKLESEVAMLQKSMDEERSKFTEKQIEEANKLIGKYRILQFKKGVNEFKNNIKDGVQQFKSMLEQAKDTLGD